MAEAEHVRKYRLIEIVGPEEAVTEHMNDTCHHLSKVFENGVIENQVEVECQDCSIQDGRTTMITKFSQFRYILLTTGIK